MESLEPVVQLCFHGTSKINVYVCDAVLVHVVAAGSVHGHGGPFDDSCLEQGICLGEWLEGGCSPDVTWCG